MTLHAARGATSYSLQIGCAGDHPSFCIGDRRIRIMTSTILTKESDKVGGLSANRKLAIN